MKLIYLKSELKCDSFHVAINIKIQFFRVLVTIEPGRSLLQFVTTNCLKSSLSHISRPSWQAGRLTCLRNSFMISLGPLIFKFRASKRFLSSMFRVCWTSLSIAYQRWFGPSVYPFSEVRDAAVFLHGRPCDQTSILSLCPRRYKSTSP